MKTKEIEQLADLYRKSMYPDDTNPTGYYNEAGYNGFIAGYKQAFADQQPANNDCAVRVVEREIALLETAKELELTEYKYSSITFCINKLKHILKLLQP
jgi:hypothetical protein